MFNKLGSGTYGVVYKAKERATNTVVALKRIQIEKEDDGVPCTAIREIALLKTLKHPNVVELRDVLYANNKLHLIFEFCECDLKEYVRARNGALASSDVRKFAYQML